MKNIKNIFLLLILLNASSCNKFHLVVKHPTIMIHGKGHDDAIGGVAVSVRVKWDVIEN